MVPAIGGQRLSGRRSRTAVGHHLDVVVDAETGPTPRISTAGGAMMRLISGQGEAEERPAGGRGAVDRAALEPGSFGQRRAQAPPAMISTMKLASICQISASRHAERRRVDAPGQDRRLRAEQAGGIEGRGSAPRTSRRGIQEETSCPVTGGRHDERPSVQSAARRTPIAPAVRNRAAAAISMPSTSSMTMGDRRVEEGVADWRPQNAVVG